MRYIILFIVLILISCRPTVQKEPTAPVELEGYIQLFEQQYLTPIDYSVYFEDLEDNVVGVCRTWSNGKKEVAIDIEFFEEYKDDFYTIQQLLWHEFGHCSFLLGHDSNLIDSYYPASIMYPYVFGMFDFYIENYDYYIHELDQKRKHSAKTFKLGDSCYAKREN